MVAAEQAGDLGAERRARSPTPGPAGSRRRGSPGGCPSGRSRSRRLRRVVGLVHDVVVVERAEVHELDRRRRPRMTSWAAGRSVSRRSAASDGERRAGPACRRPIRWLATSVRNGSSARPTPAGPSSTRARSAASTAASAGGRASGHAATLVRSATVAPQDGSRRTHVARAGRSPDRGRLVDPAGPLDLAGAVTGTAHGTLVRRFPQEAVSRVRTFHRPGPPSRRPRAGRSAPAQPQLHRHRAHPARADPRGRRGRGQGARVARHLPRGRARQVEEIIGQGGSSPSGHIPFTPRAKKVLELSLREALQLGHNYIGTEHILLGLIREGEGVAAQVLVKLGADLHGSASRSSSCSPATPARGKERRVRSGAPPAAAGRGPRRARSCSTSSVATSPSSPEKKLDPVIGREGRSSG